MKVPAWKSAVPKAGKRFRISPFSQTKVQASCQLSMLFNTAAIQNLTLRYDDNDQGSCVCNFGKIAQIRPRSTDVDNKTFRCKAD